MSLTKTERKAFIAAATAMLARQERVEHLGEQVGTRRQPSAAELKDIQVHTSNLVQVLSRLHAIHPRIHAFRFRGRIFNLAQLNGQVMLSIIKDSNIEEVAD